MFVLESLLVLYFFFLSCQSDALHARIESFLNIPLLRDVWQSVGKACRCTCRWSLMIVSLQSNSLHMLNLRYTSLSEKALSALCRVLRGTPQPVLGCLHLENVNLYGKNLYSLVCALKFNTMLKVSLI